MRVKKFEASVKKRKVLNGRITLCVKQSQTLGKARVVILLT